MRRGRRTGRVGRGRLRGGLGRRVLVVELVVVPLGAGDWILWACWRIESRICRVGSESSYRCTADPLRALLLRFCFPIARECRLHYRGQECCPYRSRLQWPPEENICRESPVQAERRAYISGPCVELEV